MLKAGDTFSFTSHAVVNLEPAEMRFLEGVKATTNKYLADYQRNPPPGRTPQEIAAYMEGFMEAFQAYTAAYLASRTARK